jgi:hypothetical protein
VEEVRREKQKVEDGRGRQYQENVIAVSNIFCLLALASAAAAAAAFTAVRVRLL